MLSDKQKQNLREQLWFWASFYQYTKLPGPPSPSKIGCVYAFEMSDYTVKIGVTTNVEKRSKSVEHAIYLNVLRVYHTSFAPYAFMTKIERRCHERFDDHRVRGEYFDIPFEEACAELNRHAEEIAATLKAADERLLDEIDFYFNEFIPEFEKFSLSRNTSATSKTVPNPNHQVIQPSLAYVYVLLMSNDLILLTKLGQSNNIRTRITQIKRETGLTVKDIYFTPLLPRDKARLIEGLCKEKFSAQCIKGEFFSADFNEMCAAVERFMKIAFATLPQVSNFERAEKILALANTMSECPERNQMLLMYSKLIADEKFT